MLLFHMWCDSFYHYLSQDISQFMTRCLIYTRSHITTITSPAIIRLVYVEYWNWCNNASCVNCSWKLTNAFPRVLISCFFFSSDIISAVKWQESWKATPTFTCIYKWVSFKLYEEIQINLVDNYLLFNICFFSVNMLGAKNVSSCIDYLLNDYNNPIAITLE